nr:hypothetical protein [Tanacetum cinerariifolium]
MFKVFNRCLTTRSSGHDQTKIKILQLFHAKKEAIQYPRFTKLIIFDLMKKFPNIPKSIEEAYLSIKDDVPLVSVYTTGNVSVRGMLIPNAFLTAEIKETNDFKDYEMVFMKVAIPINQPQPIVSTQGTNRNTPRAHRSPTVFANPLEIKKRKQTAGESSSPRKLESGSHKENPEFFVDDDDDKATENQSDDMGALHRMCKRQGYIIQDIERKCITTTKFWETHNKIDDILHEIVSQITENVTNDLIKANLKPCITNIIIEDCNAFRSKVRAFVSLEFNAHAPVIIEELFKTYVQSNVIHVHPTTTTSTETESSATLQYQLYLKMKRSLQDRADDIALWETLRRKEKRVKSRKESKRSKSARGARGSSSKYLSTDSTKCVSKQQSRQQEWDAWEEENVIDEDEATLRDSLSNQYRNAEEYAYHLEQSTNFMKNQIVWDSRQQDIPSTIPKILIFYGPLQNPNEPLRPLYNNDLFFLKYGNTKEKKYILSLHKIHAEEFPEPDLEEKLNRWVRKSSRLSMKKHGHRKLSNEGKLNSPGIEEPYLIVDDPQMGLIYLNSKNEKRVMYLEEIVKFCDATLEKVLKAVKLKMFESQFLKKPPLLSELDRDIMKAYEREISKRLSH